jgi:hypothetical protein
MALVRAMSGPQIKPFRDWHISVKLSAIGGLLGTVILVANAAEAWSKLDKWMLATRGWVYAWAAPLIKERNDKIQLVQAETNKRVDSLSLLVVKGQLLDSRSALRAIEKDLQSVSVGTALYDRLIDERAELTRAISDLEQEERRLTCLVTPGFHCTSSLWIKPRHNEARP